MANLRTADAPPAPGETLTIEADTVEEALTRLAEEAGPGAKILSADRIRRGGVAGFFAREIVQLVAELAPPSRQGVDSAFARMLAAADEQPVVEAGTEEAPAPVKRVLRIEPDPTPEVDSRGVRWSAATLLRLGMPSSVVNRLAHLEAEDDLGHLTILASILSNLCGELPDGPITTMGPRAALIRHEAALVEGPGPMHVIVGDEAVPDVRPAIVSWASAAGAPRAVALAVATGATLGFSATTAASGGWRYGSIVERVRPLDAALVLRGLMERP